METIIIICLLIVIFLLTKDTAIIKKPQKKQGQPPVVKANLPDIMGLPKPTARLSRPNTTSESHIENSKKETDNFDPEIERDDYDISVPQEEPDEVFGNVPNLEEEEEEWAGYREYSEEDGFATGVTFEELSAVGTLLQQEKLELSQQKEAVEIVRKLQGTDLFNLLENSMENASARIATLLDSSFSSENNSGSSNLRNTIDDFDIESFV